MHRHALILAICFTGCADDGATTTGSSSGTTEVGSTSFTGTTTPTSQTTSTGAPTTSTGETPTTGTTTSGTTTTGTTTTGTTSTTEGTSTTTTGTTTTEGTSTTTTGTTTTGTTTTEGTSTTTTGTTTGSTTDTTTTGTGTTTGTSSSGTSSTSSGSSSTTGPEPQCGDGTLDPGEECDDGNEIDDDACDNNCVAATCSDGQQNGEETAVDCGGPQCEACPFLLLLGGNAGGSLGGYYGDGGWTIDDLAVPTVDGTDIAVTSAGLGIGVFRYTKIGDPKDQQLQFVTWNAGAWSAPATIGDDTTRAAPTIHAIGAGAHAVFHGENFQYYYAAYNAGTWNPAAEAVGAFGPGPGSVAAYAGDPAFVFHDGGDGNALKARRRMGAWASWQTLDGDPSAFNLQPASASLSSGEVLAVQVRNNDAQLRHVRCTGVCSAPADVSGAQTSAPPALAALPGGGAALAFRGLDGLLYVSTYDGAVWTPALQVPTVPGQIHGTPAIAAGLEPAELELVYLDGASKQPHHTRRLGNVWMNPAGLSNAALERVAIERWPQVP